MSCSTSEDGRLHICRVEGEWKIAAKRRPRRRWCFKCRRRTLYRLWLYCPIGVSYYGPSPAWKCDTCQGEHDLFPGQYRVWEE